MPPINENNENQEKNEKNKKIKKNEGCYTYILRCADGTYYTGWTNDLERRLKAHNSGQGARYTRSRRPVELIYYEKYDTRREAMRREALIKQLSRQEKQDLIDQKGEKENERI